MKAVVSKHIYMNVPHSSAMLRTACVTLAVIKITAQLMENHANLDTS